MRTATAFRLALPFFAIMPVRRRLIIFPVRNQFLLYELVCCRFVEMQSFSVDLFFIFTYQGCCIQDFFDKLLPANFSTKTLSRLVFVILKWTITI